ncbi:hypothetical protein XELAEV_18027066mg [Xenopus laevis]|nr:hypothetical protein XELAEV_18027066mg [Xenopus laevis]
MESSGSESQSNQSESSVCLDTDPLCDNLVRQLQQSLGDCLNDNCFPDDPVWPPGEREKRMEQRQHPRLGNTLWCLCGNCIAMPTIRESVCCREVEKLQKHYNEDCTCITTVLDMLQLCINKHFLEFTIRNSGRVKLRQLQDDYNR